MLIANIDKLYCLGFGISLRTYAPLAPIYIPSNFPAMHTTCYSNKNNANFVLSPSNETK